jgi:hypothetical protein
MHQMPYDPNRKWCFLAFHPAMTDEQVAEILSPFEPEMIDRRSADRAIVGYWDASYEEEATRREKFNAWRDEYEADQAVKRVPFDAEAYLRARGIEPETERVRRRLR